MPGSPLTSFSTFGHLHSLNLSFLIYKNVNYSTYFKGKRKCLVHSKHSVIFGIFLSVTLIDEVTFF